MVMIFHLCFFQEGDVVRFKKILAILLMSSLLFSDDTNTTDIIIKKNSSYGQYDPKDIAQKTKNLNVDTFIQYYDDVNQTLKKYNIDKKLTNSMKKIDNKEAKDASKQFYSDQSQKNVEGMKNLILKDKTFKYKGIDPALVKHMSSSNAEYYKEKESVFPSATTNEKVGMGANERIYIYVSSSMPENLVKTYLEYAEKSGGVIHVAIRGFIGGPAKIMPTQEWVQKMATREDGTHRDVGIEINPTIQMEYGIRNVPAVLYIKNYNPINETHTGQFEKDDDYWISYGAVDLIYAIEQIEKASKINSFKTLIKKLRGDFYQ